MNRRSFAASLLAASALPVRAASHAQVTVLADETIGTISPFIHGHFVEHLGGVIYDGVWVGENSKIPNIGGIRKALVDAMLPLGSTVMRWPGGCFADSYDWRDGLGKSRPKRTNFWSTNGILNKLDPKHPARTDNNSFGTIEFLRFCKLIQCEPYLAANVRALPATVFNEWIDYCNSPAGTTTWSEQRAAHGSPEPFNVRYWGVGNESWGCGGDMTPEEYSVEFRKFTSWVPRYNDQMRLRYIASGPNSFEYEWSRRFFSALTAKSPGLLNRVWAWGLHYYCGTSGKGDSVDYSTQDYYELIAKSDRMEELIDKHWTLMGLFDRDRRVKLAIDEWGAWHRDTTAVAPHHLFGSVMTMRDAVIAGISMDTFHRHADKIVMANVAQLVNCIHTLFLADGDRFCLTPNYHVFRMYAAHQNAQAVRMEVGAPNASFKLNDKTQSTRRVNGSASRKDKTVTVTLTHAALEEGIDTVVTLPGMTVAEVTGEILAESDVHAANTFATPDRVKPKSLAAKIAGNAVTLTLPPASVAKLTIRLT
jgi:alpha-N-arabinofuranosidase